MKIQPRLLARLALIISVVLILLPLLFGIRTEINSSGLLPLLMVLLMNEFGLILCASASFLLIRAITRGAKADMQNGLLLAACLFCSVYFLISLIRFYPAS